SFSPLNPPSATSDRASSPRPAASVSQSPLLLYAGTGPSEPPRKTASGMPAAFASASHAAMSRPATAIIAMPSLPTRLSDFRPFLKVVQWMDGVAGACCRELMDGCDNASRRVLQIWLEVAAPGDAFLGLDIDQNHRPLIEQADLGYHWPAQRNDDRPY